MIYDCYYAKPQREISALMAGRQHSKLQARWGEKVSMSTTFPINCFRGDMMDQDRPFNKRQVEVALWHYLKEQKNRSSIR